MIYSVENSPTYRLRTFLAGGTRQSLEIQEHLHVSQSTVSRLIAAMRQQVVVAGKRRGTRYALRRDLRGIGSEFPVFRVNGNGDAEKIGVLWAIYPDRYLWEPTNGTPTQYPRLPWFLSSMRPEGFMGRAFSMQQHEALSLPPRLQDWREDHILISLGLRGEDCMGNLIVGNEAIARYLHEPLGRSELVPQNKAEEIYPRLAQVAMEGAPAGSSAQGEQPKFTVVHDCGDGTFRHFIVKFSPDISTEAGQRWADLLISEHHALTCINERGVPASKSTLRFAGNRVFLEVERFDRVGQFGRLPIVSLGAVDDEFYGYRDSWPAAARRMLADARLSSEHAGWLCWLSAFGDLIANTDQHFGNVSLVMTDGDRRFDLAPAYDVLPMLYRPNEEKTLPEFNPRELSSIDAPMRESVIHWATLFWGQCAADDRISENFRKICTTNLQKVTSLAVGPRLLGALK